MKLPEAKEILDLNIKEAGSKMPAETLQAVKIGSHAISRILKMRSYNIGQAILPLPGENPIPDLTPSADRKNRLRESPLGKKPRKLSECPFEHLRDYPGCYEDCPDVEQCPHSKKAKT